MTDQNANEFRFKIDHLDRFGQGVFKNPDTNKIIFIPQTLPAEEGLAKITKSKGKVQFAKVKNLEKPSNDRIEPECKHFLKCRGCTFWMTPYEKEKEFKKSAFARNLRSSLELENEPSINFLSAETRHQYRNRIQLHYCRKQKMLGFKDDQNNIIKVDKCLVASDKINQFLQNILIDNNWLHFLRKTDPVRGHFEIYEGPNQEDVLFAINQDYAFGGFSQVNQAANELLLQHIQEIVQSKQVGIEKGDLIFDIFGGAGNLTKCFTDQKCHVFDGMKSTESLAEHQQFHEINLYSSQAIPRVAETTATSPKVLVLDPPRSGLRNLNEFLQAIKPQYVVYVSCQYDSMIRDLRSSQSEIDSFIDFSLCDLFPATHHVEAISFFKTVF